MKTILALLMIALFSLGAAAQGETAEKDFTRNLKKFKVEKYSMGEDASSGYDYVVYKRGADIVKIRTIWSSSANPAWWVEDAYYQAGEPVLLVSLTLTKRQFKAVKGGSQIALPVTDKCYFKDGKMVKWLEKGKAVPETDTRWQETEKDSLATAKDTLEFYPELKDM
jgi:hypothetical protein